MTETFQLHPQLAADTTIVTDGPLSHVLLMNDARYPWLILVPKRANLVDYDDLSADERKILGDECAAVSSALKRRFKAHKTNVAMLGNMVPQLRCPTLTHIKAGDFGIMQKTDRTKFSGCPSCNSPFTKNTICGCRAIQAIPQHRISTPP